ncbi:hypothetical protein Vretifemale_15944 [Volvox reticuliferus]|nr:hypothetical protein Vretifemale_15944 [Volvox reticuliferus]
MLGNASHFNSIDPTRHFFHPFCVGNLEMANKNPSQVLNWEGTIQRVMLLQGAAAVQQDDDGSAGANGRTLWSIGYDSDSASISRSDAESASLHHHPGENVIAAEAVTSAMGMGATVADPKLSRARRLQRKPLLYGESGGGGGGGGRRARRRDMGPDVFVLKIDVEGFEWQLLSEWGPDTPGLPAFLAIEIHNWVEEFVLAPASPPPRPRYSTLAWWLYGKRMVERDKARAAAAVLARRQRVYAGELSLMFLHLARLGYAVVSREDNPCGDSEGKICCSEFLLIRLRGPEEGRPGTWDWTHWLDSVKEGLRPLVQGRARRRLLG